MFMLRKEGAGQSWLHRTSTGGRMCREVTAQAQKKGAGGGGGAGACILGWVPPPVDSGVGEFLPLGGLSVEGKACARKLAGPALSTSVSFRGPAFHKTL